MGRYKYQQKSFRDKIMAVYSSLLAPGLHKEPSLIDLLLNPVRQWFDAIEVRDAQFARWLCRMIPAQCPFERDIKLFGHTLFHIPPMCKLNPLYEQFVGLRFRALCFLADECGEDVSAYC